MSSISDKVIYLYLYSLHSIRSDLFSAILLYCSAEYPISIVF